METDDPPCQDHCNHIEQFIGKGPSKRTEDQLKQVRCNCDGIRKPHALPGEKGYF